MQANIAPRTRDTLQVGDTGSFTKTITEANISQFADASGDCNPLHLDDNYAARTRFGRRIAHGVLSAGLISAALGNELPGLGTIFVELHVRFLKPVYIGDTVTANVMVSEILNPQRVYLLVACVNQCGQDLAIGHALVVPPRETRLLTKSDCLFPA